MGGEGAGLSQSARCGHGAHGPNTAVCRISHVQQISVPSSGPAKQSLSLGVGATMRQQPVSLRSALEGYTRGGDFIHVVFAREVAVPCADGSSLRHRPLLRGLPARTDNAPYLLPAARGKHGFQMYIGAAACKAGADGVRIKLFHIRYLSSFEPTSQELRLLIKSTRVKEAAEKYFFQAGAFLTFC